MASTIATLDTTYQRELLEYAQQQQQQRQTQSQQHAPEMISTTQQQWDQNPPFFQQQQQQQQMMMMMAQQQQQQQQAPSISQGQQHLQSIMMPPASSVAPSPTAVSTMRTFEDIQTAKQSYYDIHMATATAALSMGNTTSSNNHNNLNHEGSSLTTNHPPIVKIQKRSKTLVSKLASPIMNKQKVQPGRLFVRMSSSNNLTYELGEFTIGLQMTDIDGHIVDKARKKVQKRAEKEARKLNGGSSLSGKVFGNKSSAARSGAAGGANANAKLEARDDIEGTPETLARHHQELAAKERQANEVPQLASLLIQHTTTTPDEHGDITTKTIWSSSPGLNFVGGASLSSLNISTGGNINEHFSRLYTIQTVDTIHRGPAHVLTMVGQLSHTILEGGILPEDSPVYTLQFSLVNECSRALKFTLRVDGGGADVVGSVRKLGGGEGNSIEAAKASSTSSSMYDYTVNSVQMFVRADMTSTENELEKEAFFGLGARYSRPNLRGQEVQICHPSTTCDGVVGTTTTSSSSLDGGSTSSSSGGGGGGGGSTDNNPGYYSTKQTSNPSTLPHFISSSGISLHLHNIEPTIFDFTPSAWYSIRTPCTNVLSGTFACGDNMMHAMELHTSLVGRTRPLPKWTQRNGILVGIQGGSIAVQHTCRNFFKYKCPISGILIKDWTGSKATPAANNTNNSAWYNYVLEREHYPGWQPLMDSLERRGISVGLYVTPYLEEIPMVLRSGRRYLYSETKSDYFVKKKIVVKSKKQKEEDGSSYPSKDGSGVSSNINNSKKSKNKITKSFSTKTSTMKTTQLTMYNHFKKTNCGMLDCTNYNATSWFKSVLKEEVLDCAGASFWIADMSMGGPPMDGIYTSSNNYALSYHNSYIDDWAKVNRDAIKEAGRDGDGFFIVNSAFGSTAKHAGCTSLGDYVTNFHHDNGNILRSVLNGIINGGFSGLTHGHCAVNLAVPRQLKSAVGNTIDSKSREMICRWFEMTAFTTLFRTHDGENGMNDNGGVKGSSGGGASANTLCAYEDEAVMKALTRWSRVYVALAEYRLQLLNEASFKGYPVVRHPVLHFPCDEQFSKSEQKDNKNGGGGDAAPGASAFMLGDLIYAVPVVKSGVTKRKVYLPEGEWIHLWTMELVAGPENVGKTIEVKCPLGEPPIFIRDHYTMHQFVALLRQKRIIKDKKKSSKKSIFSSFRRSTKSDMTASTGASKSTKEKTKK